MVRKVTEDERFPNWDAVQRHMRDVGHCKMNPEKMDLVDEFYDYSEANLAFLQRKFDQLEVRTKREIHAPKQEPICEKEEDEWEDCESEEEAPQEEKEPVDEDDEQYVLIRGYWHPLSDKIVDSKFIKEHLQVNDKGEVVLPGGKILGHRKYAKYYKQNVVQMVRKKSELVRALAYREMERGAGLGRTQVAKFGTVMATLERYILTEDYLWAICRSCSTDDLSCLTSASKCS